MGADQETRRTKQLFFATLSRPQSTNCFLSALEEQQEVQEEDEEEEVQQQQQVVLPPLFWVHVLEEKGLKPESVMFSDGRKGVFVM